MSRYIYSWIRKDLSHTQRIIQTLHSGYELALNIRPFDDGKPSSVVLFEVEDEDDIIAVHRFLLEEGFVSNKDFHVFFEPDRNDGWTSITTRPMEGLERGIFADFKLYKDENYTDEDKIQRDILIVEGRGS